MTPFSAAVMAAYVAVTCLLAVFGAHRGWLLLRFRRRGVDIPPVESSPLPSVTVQLPMFNERAVAERVIRAAGRLDYPRERLEIQVLDDSDDGTRAIVDREIERLNESGLSARVLRRSARSGYKAGALSEGLRSARGEFVCIFDADFVPPPGFLRSLLGGFADPAVGMVQGRWAHLNRDDGCFTRAQATLLDGHFVITHKVRFDRNLYFHFNGTAGIWRREAIERAGGWHHDTLTEDLDLSYRAQLGGDRFVYAVDVEAPAELPGDIAAFKTQQARWTQGAVQVGRKLMGRILAAPVRGRVKLEAGLHFLSHGGHPLVLALAVLLPLAVLDRSWSLGSWLLAVPALSMPVVVLFYERAQRALGRPAPRRLVDSCLAVILGLGMSWSLTRAVLAGLIRDGGVFLRTPKRGGSTSTYGSRLSELPGVELAWAAWCAWGAVRAVIDGRALAGFVLFLFVSGFAWVGGLSVCHAISTRIAAPTTPVEADARS